MLSDSGGVLLYATIIFIKIVIIITYVIVECKDGM
jgi:hypothetical protein